MQVLTKALRTYLKVVSHGAVNCLKIGMFFFFFTIKRRIERSSQLELASVISLNCRLGDCCAAVTAPLFILSLRRSELSAVLKVRFPIANNCTRRCSMLKGFQGNRRRFLKISPPHPLTRTFRMPSLFHSNFTMDSTKKYKGRNFLPEYRNVCLARVPPQCQYSSRASLLLAAITRKK